MLYFFETVGVLAGIVSFLSFVAYYVSILRGKTTPNRATWLILTIVGILVASSYYSVGARETLWVPISYIVGPLITFLLSIKYGEGGWTTFDKFCLTASLISVLLWLVSGFALIALIINILIDFFGMLPTLKKSFERPKSEQLYPWSLTLLASVLNLIAIRFWTFEIWIYPLYMLLINGCVFYLLVFRKNRKKLL